MAGLMVYIPGSTANDGGAELRRVGLDDLIDSSVNAIVVPINASGPDGGSGRMITFDRIGLPGTPREYDAKLQQWLQADEYWIGCVKAAKPTPAELQRADIVDGVEVTLRDRNQWVIAIEEFLPRRLTVDRRTGKETRVVAERHREYSNWCNSLYEMFLSDGFLSALKKLSFEIPNGLSFCAMALSKNYRINRDVVDLLELVEEYEAWEIAKIATGIGPALGLAAAQKKTGSNYHSASETSMPTSIPAGCSGAAISQHSST